MNRIKWLMLLNLVLFLSMFLEIITGVILFFDLFASWLTLIFRVHAYNGFLLIGLVIIHLMFNWGWIKANFFKRRSKI